MTKIVKAMLSEIFSKSYELGDVKETFLEYFYEDEL